jgi:hypothetical protein
MPRAIPIAILADFQQQLVGSWENRNFGTDNHGNPIGGAENPLSYNIMPLPQRSDPDGYILKNFSYSERLKFNNDNVEQTLAIAAEAPNRGSLVSQNCRAIFYEQQVMFAEGPAVGKVVHVENGSWLWLPRFVQQPGPYPDHLDMQMASDALQQPSNMTIAKQISVPHGNSILALGGFDTHAETAPDSALRQVPYIKGSPFIPDAPAPYPSPAIPVVTGVPDPALKSNLNADVRYQTLHVGTPADKDYQNPQPMLTRWPNKPLQMAVAIIQPDKYMHWSVTTEPLNGGRGIVSNIPFEREVSRVSEYWADYWMLFKDHKKYLAYTQTILMVLKILDKTTGLDREYVFPHVTCNTVTYCE